MSCEHNHLRFTDGQFKLQCIDCDRYWVAFTAEGGPDLSMKSQMPQPFRETRHDRYVLARTERPLKITLTKK